MSAREKRRPHGGSELARDSNVGSREQVRSHSRIADEAAEWVVRRDRGFSAEERRAFAEWQNADPRNARELERIADTWHGMNALAAAPELGAMADAVVARARRRRTRRRQLILAVATLAAAAAVAVMFVNGRGGGEPRLSTELAATAPSENVQVLASTLRRVSLPDGSFAELNGNSRIDVEFTPSERRVRLLEGEAHFIVEKDPSRPFFVTAGSVTVRAVGTAFNVRLGAAAIEVLVTEGKVALAADGARTRDQGSETRDLPGSELVAGQRAIVERTSPNIPTPAPVAISDVDPAEVERELGWQSTRLVFNNTPLPEVVDAFNRYNPRRLVIGDPMLRTRTLTGVFRADNVDGFVRLLRASSDVKAEERSAGETVLLPVQR